MTDPRQRRNVTAGDAGLGTILEEEIKKARPMTKEDAKKIFVRYAR